MYRKIIVGHDGSDLALDRGGRPDDRPLVAVA